MTRKSEVKLRVWANFDLTPLERMVEVDMVENAAGRVFVDYGDQGAVSVKVDVIVPDVVRGFIEETRLILRPDHTMPYLRGKVTPRGWTTPLDGGLCVDGRPLLRELYDGGIALELRLNDVRKVMWDEERERVNSRTLPEDE